MPGDSSARSYATWLMMLVCTWVCLPPVIIELSQSDATRSGEIDTLLVSRDTWQNVKSGKPDAWLVPKYNGHAALNRPPLTIWLNMLSWTGLDPVDVQPEQLIFRARLLGVLLLWLALAGTFWSGKSLGGLKLAALATLIAGSTIGVIHQARSASYDTHVLAWVSLAVAGGLWGMRPLKPLNSPARVVVGWLICSLAMWAGVMTKGPLAIVFIITPLITALVVTPWRRLTNLFGLIFAMLLAMLLAVPWFLYVIETVSHPLSAMFSDWQVTQLSNYRPWYDLAYLIYLMFPWSWWLIGALVIPFVRIQQERRRELWIAWCWLLLVSVILALHPVTASWSLVLALPAAGLLIAAVWIADYRDMDVAPASVLRFLAPAHWVMIGIATVGLPLFIYYQYAIAGQVAWLRRPQLVGVPASVVGVGTACLLFLVIVGVLAQFRRVRVVAAAATALWSITFFTIVYYGYVQSYHGQSVRKHDARRVALLVDRDDLVYLVVPPGALGPLAEPVVNESDESSDAPAAAQLVSDAEPDSEFLFYVGRTVSAVELVQLGERAEDRLFVLVKMPRVLAKEEQLRSRLKAMGYVMELKIDQRVQLYASPGAGGR